MQHIDLDVHTTGQGKAKHSKLRHLMGTQGNVCLECLAHGHPGVDDLMLPTFLQRIQQCHLTSNWIKIYV